MNFSIRIGTVTGREIKQNRDSVTEFIMLQVEFLPDDVQTVALYSQAGEDTSPPDGSQVIVLQIGEAFKIAIASDDGISPSMEPGEKKIYSSLDSDIKAFINLLNSGIIELNGNTDFVVRFNALNTALQTMLSSLNADIISAGGTGNTTLDISAAKADEVKIK